MAPTDNSVVRYFSLGDWEIRGNAVGYLIMRCMGEIFQRDYLLAAIPTDTNRKINYS